MLVGKVRLAFFHAWYIILISYKYTSRRFANLEPEHTKDLHDYLLNISLARGSGEYSLTHILAPGAHARLPMEYRIAALKDIPITFVYGAHDWMDPEGGVRSIQRLREAGNMKSKMVVVPGAGHHGELLIFMPQAPNLTTSFPTVYLDNPEAVNKLLVKELDNALRDSRV